MTSQKHLDILHHIPILACLIAIPFLIIGCVDQSNVTFTKIADTDTPIPKGIGSFEDFGGFSVGPSFRDGIVAFDAAGSSEQHGIYTWSDGKLEMVVNTDTLIPGGEGSFEATEKEGYPFGSPSTSNGSLSFRGFGPNNQEGIYIYSDGQLGLVADRNSREVGVVRELSFTTADTATVTIPGVPGEFSGDRFIILAEDAKLHPIAQTRIDMLAANTGPLNVIKEVAIPMPERIQSEGPPENDCPDQTTCMFDAFPNIAQGEASLSLERTSEQTEILRVENIGSSLTDGVAQILPETMEMETTLQTPNFSLSSDGATLVTTQTGIVDEEPDQLFSKMTIINNGGSLQVIGDWSPIGTTSYEIQVYKGSELVTSQKGLPSGQLDFLGIPDIALMRCHIWIHTGSSMFFSFDTPPTPSLPNVAFCIVDNSGQVREYTSNAHGETSLLADETTLTPNESRTFTNFAPFTDLSEGVVAFVGSSSSDLQGIYVHKGEQLLTIADTDTIIPGSTSTFTEFGSVSLDVEDLAFKAVDGQEQQAIYTWSDGILKVVADTDTLIPGDTENFSGFGWGLFTGPSLHEGNLAFLGNTADFESSGIYTTIGGNLIPVIATGDQLDEKTVDGLLMSPEALHGNQLAIQVFFDDESQGLFLAKVGTSFLAAEEGTTTFSRLCPGSGC